MFKTSKSVPCFRWFLFANVHLQKFRQISSPERFHILDLACGKAHPHECQEEDTDTWRTAVNRFFRLNGFSVAKRLWTAWSLRTNASPGWWTLSPSCLMRACHVTSLEQHFAKTKTVLAASTNVPISCHFHFLISFFWPTLVSGWSPDHPQCHDSLPWSQTQQDKFCKILWFDCWWMLIPWLVNSCQHVASGSAKI